MIDLVNEETYIIINENKNIFNNLKQQRASLIHIFNEKYSNFHEKHELKTLIEQRTCQINFLKDEYNRKLTQINEKKKLTEQINKRVVHKCDAIKLYKEKINKIKDTIRVSERIAATKMNKQPLDTKLSIVEYQKIRLKELNKYVFSLIEIRPDDDNTLDALKEARMTTYINGRWILTNDPFHYMIVKSKLPTNGDYSAYYKENDSKDEAKAVVAAAAAVGAASLDQQRLLSNPSRNEIASALIYTTQFVNLVAFYLNVVLPYNLPHNKFCSQNLSQTQFRNSLAKLNVNIIYLCLNQLVPVNHLIPQHTLENLYHFLEYSNKMKIRIREKHPTIFSNDTIKLIDQMFDTNPSDDFDLDFVPNLIFNDCEEWEKLPNSDEIPMDATNNLPMSHTKSGLIASSTNLISSVTSFFSKHLGGHGGGGHTA